MGRDAWVYYRSLGGNLRPDRGIPGTTRQSVGRFADTSVGPLAMALWDQKLVRYDAAGNVDVNPDGVRAAVQTFNKRAVQDREYSEEYTLELAYEQTWYTTPRKVINAENREMKAKAEAVLVAAKAAGVTISPTDKRALNAAARGRWWDYVYGEKDERGQRRYERGTLISRFQAQRGNSVRYSTPEAEARAREAREVFFEYTGRTGRSRYGVAA